MCSPTAQCCLIQFSWVNGNIKIQKEIAQVWIYLRHQVNHTHLMTLSVAAVAGHYLFTLHTVVSWGCQSAPMVSLSTTNHLLALYIHTQASVLPKNTTVCICWSQDWTFKMTTLSPVLRRYKALVKMRQKSKLKKLKSRTIWLSSVTFAKKIHITIFSEPRYYHDSSAPIILILSLRVTKAVCCFSKLTVHCDWLNPIGGLISKSHKTRGDRIMGSQ